MATLSLGFSPAEIVSDGLVGADAADEEVVSGAVSGVVDLADVMVEGLALLNLCDEVVFGDRVLPTIIVSFSPSERGPWG